jgi:hypothetical protein
MGYDDNYSPFTATVARVERTRTPLWRLTKEAHTVEASLLVDDAGAVEVQIFSNGEIFRGRRFASRTLALQYAGKLRHQYRERGWGGEDGNDR